MDREWRLTYVNRRAGEIPRPGDCRGKGAILGKAHWGLVPGALGTRIEESFRRAVRDRVPVSFEVFFPPRDGWFDVLAYRCCWSGLTRTLRSASLTTARVSRPTSSPT